MILGASGFQSKIDEPLDGEPHGLQVFRGNLDPLLRLAFEEEVVRILARLALWLSTAPVRDSSGQPYVQVFAVD